MDKLPNFDNWKTAKPDQSEWDKVNESVYEMDHKKLIDVASQVDPDMLDEQLDVIRDKLVDKIYFKLKNSVLLVLALLLTACGSFQPEYLDAKDLPSDFEVQARSFYESDDIHLCYLVLSDTDINVETPKVPIVVTHPNGGTTDDLKYDSEGHCKF